MKTKIHELRTRIDGLAGLVRSLEPIEERKYLNESTKMGYYYVVGFKASEELKDCHKSLLLAKAWLGKVLSELGDTNPYAENEGKRKEVGDIEPVADCQQEQCPEGPLTPMVLHFPRVAIKGTEVRGLCDSKEMNHIEKVDWLRGEIVYVGISLINTENEMRRFTFTVGMENAIKHSLNHLTEARFHLGFELQRIKEAE